MTNASASADPARLPKKVGTKAAATRARLVDAAIETLIVDGYSGASARVIAKRADVNQALIFYHFGSLNDLLLAALDVTSKQRMARYEQELANVSTLPELVALARVLHQEDVASGHVVILTQLMSGTSSAPELRAGVFERFTPWLDVVRNALGRVLDGSPYLQIVPLDQLAFGVVSMFLGLEMLTHLAPEASDEDALFQTLATAAGIANAIIQNHEPAISPE